MTFSVWVWLDVFIKSWGPYKSWLFELRRPGSQIIVGRREKWWVGSVLQRIDCHGVVNGLLNEVKLYTIVSKCTLRTQPGSNFVFDYLKHVLFQYSTRFVVRFGSPSTKLWKSKTQKLRRVKTNSVGKPFRRSSKKKIFKRMSKYSSF